MPAYKIDSSCSAPPVLHPLGKHRPPHRLRNYWRSIDGTTLVLTKACNWPLAFKQQPSSGDLLLEMAMLHTQRHVCTLIKRKKRTRLEEEGKDRGRKRERGSTTPPQQELCDPAGNVTRCCLSWKDPINVSALSPSRPSPWMAPIRAQSKSND